MSVTSFEEFRSDLGSLRQEINRKAGKMDVKLVAAWVDKLAIMLEDMSSSIALLEERVDILSGGDALKPKARKTKAKKRKK